VSTAGVEARGPILWVRRVYGDGRHNAFTALVRWRDRFWLAFRNAESHMSFDGRILVLASADALEWREVHRIERGGDDRDPHLLVAGDRLVLTINQRHPDHRQAWATWTDDGASWSAPEPCYDRDFIIWKPRALHRRYLAGGYHVNPDRSGRFVNLIASDDGLAWRTEAPIGLTGQESETLLHAPSPERLLAFIRWQEEPCHARIAEAERPFTDWRTRPAGIMLQGQDCVSVGDALLVGSRAREGEETRTALYRYADGCFEPYAVLPSGGDTSYPAFAWQQESRLLMSYYSSHDGPSSIYLAEVDVSGLRT
jgi:hypothetical protein